MVTTFEETYRKAGNDSKIQMMATRKIPELSVLPCEERLYHLRLPTLQERREIGNLIMMYKMAHGMGKLDREDSVIKDDGQTRGHEYKLKKTKGLKDVKKHSFPNRSLKIWNGLEKEVVGARNIHMFKSKLDVSRYGDRITRA